MLTVSLLGVPTQQVKDSRIELGDVAAAIAVDPTVPSRCDG